MQPVIEFNNVTYTYPLTKQPAVKNINLQIEPGKLYGVCGENGSGKTTLCLMMCGFVPNFYKGKLEGEVLIKGKKNSEYKPGELSNISSYVFQNPFNQISGVKTSVFEELAFSLENFGVDPDEMERRVLEIAERTGITHLLEKNPFELSGGQQQRVALASVLVLKPEIMVIDEPTSQLDPEGTEGVFEIISEMKHAGSTIILVEHKVDLMAEYADEVIAMKDGEIIACGPTHEVLSDTSLLDRGVALPQSALIGNALKEHGFDFDVVPVLEEEAVEQISKIYKKGDKNNA